jgi:hypothetical protein
MNNGFAFFEIGLQKRKKYYSRDVYTYIYIYIEMSGTPSSGAHNPTARRLLASRAATSSSTLAQQPPSQPVTSRAAAALRNINTAPEDLDNNEVRILDIPNYISGSGGFYDWLDRDLVAGASGRKYRFAPELSKSGKKSIYHRSRYIKSYESLSIHQVSGWCLSRTRSPATWRPSPRPRWAQQLEPRRRAAVQAAHWMWI